jgi:hypothetical protein
MTFKIFACAMVACSICFVLVMIFWQRMILADKEQELATRVARALHEIGRSATAQEIRRKIYRDGGALEAIEDIRWSLRLMEIEGTVRVTLGARLALNGAVVDAPVYTLTPRVGSSEQDAIEVRRGGGGATPSGGGGVEQGAYPLAVSTDCSGGEC